MHRTSPGKERPALRIMCLKACTFKTIYGFIPRCRHIGCLWDTARPIASGAALFAFSAMFLLELAATKSWRAFLLHKRYLIFRSMFPQLSAKADGTSSLL